MVSIGQDATVGDAIHAVRRARIDDDIDAVYIVDDNGKYVGHVQLRRLLILPEDAQIKTIVDTKPLYARIDASRNEVENLFDTNELINLPVIDHEHLLVGRICRSYVG